MSSAIRLEQLPAPQVIQPASYKAYEPPAPGQAPSETAAPQQEIVIVQPVPVGPPPELDYTFDVRQQWEGIVQSVSGDEFVVVLKDMRDPHAPELEATLLVEEVSGDDLALLEPGAVLYWTIGYEINARSNQRTRASILRLRRLPAWSRQDVARVDERARALEPFFGAGH